MVLTIPMVDSDGDTVRCRWATGNECVSVCNSLPLATLDSVCIHVILLSIRTLDYSGNCLYMYFRRKFVIITCIMLRTYTQASQECIIFYYQFTDTKYGVSSVNKTFIFFSLECTEVIALSDSVTETQFIIL